MNRSCKRRHAQVHLPALTAEQAWVVVDVLERIIKAIWSAHGSDMVAYEQRYWHNKPVAPYLEEDPSPKELPF